MKELVVISGKGGTGKTSIVAGFASLAENCVIADCDVDAADLHLIMNPVIKKRESFSGGFTAFIERDKCIECDKCREICRFGAVSESYEIDEISCEGCGICAYFCPEDSIVLVPNKTGEWYVSDTRFGPLVHARLGVAEENSGKLVTIVKNQAKEIAEKENREIVIVDGSPGIGCPVIASLTGSNYVLVVTEPTLSGKHDMDRVVKLVKHFGINAGVCINKYDLNPEITKTIQTYCSENKIDFIGRIPYDDIFTRAIINGKIVLELPNGKISGIIKNIWEIITEKI